MPNYSAARIVNRTEKNQSAFNEAAAFLQTVRVGDVIRLTLENGESSRAAMRALNGGAKQVNCKLFRISASTTEVVFRIVKAQESRKPNTTIATVPTAKK